jgi:hypothetical protein
MIQQPNARRHLAPFCLSITALAVALPGRAPASAMMPVPLATPTMLALAAGQPSTLLSGPDLQELVSPVALYPDTLLANVLAASVFPEEIVEARKFVASGGKVDENSPQSWDPAVKSVAEFPAALTLLADSIEWTTALGQAYLAQSADMLKAVQALRAKAWDNGALRSTPQQTVITEGQTIIIEPAQPQIIYVPQYNPSVVYVDRHDDAVVAGLIGFGLGITVGLIFADLNCNWYGGYVHCGWGGWHGGWHGGNDVNININNNTNNNINIGNNIGNNIGSNNRPYTPGEKWKPDPNRARPSATSNAIENYKGVGAANGLSKAKVPGRTPGTQPLAATPTPQTLKPRPGAATQRPAAPVSRPQTSAPVARPSTPTPAAKPASVPKPASIPKPAAAPQRPSYTPPSQGTGLRPNSGSRPAARPNAAPAPRPAARPAPRGR